MRYRRTTNHLPAHYGGGVESYSYFADADEPVYVPHVGEYTPGAVVTVNAPREYPKWDFSEDPNGKQFHISDTPQVLSEGQSIQGELFHNKPAKIRYLEADPSMRITAMNLVAKAMLDHPDAVADSDLSKHSSRLVKKGMKLGAITPNPENATAQVTNDMQLDHYYNYKFPGMSDIPDIEMKQAKAHLRSIIRPPRPKPLNSTQFQQLTLFGE